MATTQLAIAKVAFSAVLLRQDPTSVPRPEIDDFLGLVNTTVSRCTPVNVQQCKRWIVKNLLQSPLRLAALAKYLTALVNSFSGDVDPSKRVGEPSSKRKRLHVLYILNDVLYHAQIKDGHQTLSTQLEPFLPGLVQSAAGFANCPKHKTKVSDLVKLWGERGYFAANFVSKLESAISEAPSAQAELSTGNGSAFTATKVSKEVPYVMPAMHGDESTPWYDLPAANWLPYIEPNSTRPMNPSMIKPLQFVAGPADKNLVKAVQGLLEDVDRIYTKDRRRGDDPAEDISELGQKVVMDEISGNIISGETYYGWSRSFCNKMKQRRKKGNGSPETRVGRSLSRSVSRSLSRSSSRPVFKRRRVSDSRSRSSSRGSRRKGRSPPGRSRSPLRKSRSRERRRQRSYSRSLSSSRLRSGSRERRHQRSRSLSRGRFGSPDRTTSENPPRVYDRSSTSYPVGPRGNQMPQSYPNPNHHPNPNPQFPQFPMPIPNFMAFGMVPPPPMPNYSGQWPPPPPPLPPTMSGAGQPWMAGVLPMGGWQTPVPTPQQMMGQSPFNNTPYQQASYQYGQGGRGGNYHGSGRGSWRGGGRGW